MPTNRMSKLTPSQKLAVETIDRPTAIIAGAGSGKTKVLTERLLQILTTKKIPLSQIVCLTFTEKAAQELKNRIAKSLPVEVRKELPFAAIGTFHGFCLNILKEYAPLLGRPKNFSIWDEHISRLAIHKACRNILLEALKNKEAPALLLVEELEFRPVLSLLEELMAFRWHWEKLLKQEARSKKQENKEKQLWEATTLLYRQILQNYDEEKNFRQALDFQDLEILTLNLLSQNAEVLKTLQRKFHHILVDEVQDINDLQRELIQRLFSLKKNTLCVVGDPNQSIYRFRGANVDGFNELLKEIKKAGGLFVYLKENFRSTLSILNFTNHISNILFAPPQDGLLLPTRNDGGEKSPLLLEITSPLNTPKESLRKLEAQTIANWIVQKHNDKKTPFGHFALLFQSLTDIHIYEEAFRKLRIPYRLFGGRGFLQSQEVLDLLFCLKLFTQPDDRLALVGLMRSPLIGLNDIRITKLCLDHPTGLLDALLQEPEAFWLKELLYRKKTLSGAEILETATHQTHYDSLLNALDPSGTKLANVEKLMELVRELEIEEQLSLEELVGYFEDLKRQKAPLASATGVDMAEEACQFLTIHAAKGLEFETVVLPDLMRQPPMQKNRFVFVRDKGIGLLTRKDPQNLLSNQYVAGVETQGLLEREKIQDYQERKRLLYVALTRARDQLVLVWHPNLKQTGPWYGWLKEAIESFPRPLQKISSESLKAESIFKEEASLSKFVFLKKRERKSWVGPAPYYTVTELKDSRWQTQTVTVEHREKGTLVGENLGNLVHAVLKRIQDPNDPPLKRWIDTSLFELGLLANEQETKEAFDLIHNFLKSAIAPERWDGLHEFPFRLKIGPAFISGVMDYVFEKDGGLVLCDFKTDTVFDPQKYQFQMDVYALALAKGQGEKVLETRLLYLKTNQAKIEVSNPQRLKKTEEKLINLVNSFRVFQ